MEKLDVIDIKAIFLRYFYLWPYIVGCMFLGLIGAYITNFYSSKIYQVSTVVQFKEQPNPFSDLTSGLKVTSSNTSEKTESNMVILKSYAHNKKVISKLNLEVGYTQIGTLKNTIAINSTPFIVIWDSSHVQLINQPFTITANENNTFTVSLDKKINQINVFDYNKSINYSTRLNNLNHSKIIKINDWYESPYFKFKISPREREITPFSGIAQNEPQFNNKGYQFTFRNYDQLVSQIQNHLSIKQITDEASIIQLDLKGGTKNALVNYLNTSVEIFKASQLTEKNLMSVNTIKFIDKEIQGVHDTLLSFQQELEVAQRENNLIDLSSQANFIYQKFSDLDEEQSVLESKLGYYKYLQNDLLNTNNDFSNVIPPSMAGVTDRSLVEGVQSLVALNFEKSKLKQDLKENNPVIINLDVQIANSLSFLKNNLANIVKVTELQIANQEKTKRKLEAEFKTLPSAEQSILNIKRKHNIINAQYTFLMEKRSEAGIVMAANLSDNKVIDLARDSGQGPISPKKNIAYLIGLMLGVIIPVGFIFIKEFLNNKIRSIQDVENSIQAPIIGVVGHVRNLDISELQNQPISPISESYRSLRTNCQDIMAKKETANVDEKGTKKGQVILITSLVEGEGKSLSTLNLALSYTSGGHKTVILAADLRRQTMHKRMKLDNHFGLSDYLKGKDDLENIIQSSEIENLDFIGSGPKPRNPGELILSFKMKEIIDRLKEMYDFVIIDTPPVGLVSDAKYLMAYSDLNIHVVRHGYTRLDLMENLNKLYKNAALENYHILLNDVHAHSKNHQNYGLAYSYGYSYGGLYGSEYYKSDQEKLN